MILWFLSEPTITPLIGCYGGSRLIWRRTLRYGASFSTAIPLPAGTLKRLYAKAQVVLVQGGPGSIQDARATGAIPLVVPRRVEFDEVVDNHQVPFVTMMEKQGGAVIVESRADLFDKLTLAFENPSLFHAAKPYVANPSIAAEQLAQGLDNLLSGKTRRVEGYIARFKQAARAHAAGKQEMARINAITPSE